MKTRFSLHYIIGLFLWILSMGLTIMLSIEIIFPLLGIMEDSRSYDAFVFMIFIVNITLCSMVFAWYFVGPLLYMMKWIEQLTEGKFESPAAKDKIYDKKNRLRHRYRLYKEVINNFNSLAEYLQNAESDRIKLEESKKDWIAGISHDLKTPLTYITGYSALLLNPEYIWTEVEKTSFINEISQKGQHIESLISDLSFSFQINNVQSPFPLNKTEQDIIEFTKKVIADIGSDPRAFDYRLSFHSDEPLIHIRFDERLIYRVLQNLLMNAIIHNPKGTSVAVTIINEETDIVKIIVSDDGEGMDQETAENLFNKYYRGTTTNSSELGTGLGMAIVKGLVLVHGGHILAASKVSKGTEITIQLPKNINEDINNAVFQE